MLCDLRNIVHIYKINGAGADLVSEALGEAADFVGVRRLPQRAFTTVLAQLAIVGEFACVGIKGIAMEGEMRHGDVL